MPHSAAFIDAKCRKCGAHIGWHGRVTDRPACPRCGDKMPQEELAADQAEMDNFRELLRELREANPNWGKWQKARVAAGLTLRQAAKLLEVAPTTLSEIEQGINTPSQFLADRMANCYASDGVFGVQDAGKAGGGKREGGRMNIGKYMVAVEERRPGRKTSLWHIRSRSSGDTLGTVSWYGRWRQYTFNPVEGATFSADCLEALKTFIGGLKETDYQKAIRTGKKPEIWPPCVMSQGDLEHFRMTHGLTPEGVQR